MQGMSQGHLMMPNHQVQIQGSDASAFQFDHCKSLAAVLPPLFSSDELGEPSSPYERV